MPPARPVRRRAHLPDIDLDQRRALPLYQQLYAGLRQQVLSGQLRPGSRLAATRELARHFDVSRFTVVNAMERLLAEGYLSARRGSGTFVSATLPEHLIHAPVAAGHAVSRRRGPAPASPPLSARGTRIAGLAITGPRHDYPRPFHPRRTALDVFPVRTWSRIMRRHWNAPRHHELDYGDPAGHLPLRHAIAGHVSATRGLRCEPEQVIVTSGSQQAFDLLFRLLLDPGDAAWMEDPGYLDIRAALIAAGAEIIPIPIDKAGMIVSAGITRQRHARIAIVSPSHQYPSGVTLSAARRLELLRWARQQRAWIIEDDYDSYFRYAGRPMSSLRGMDRSDQVLYVGTFSKTMFPSLRLGYCIVSDTLIEPATHARAILDRNSPIVAQAALAEFIVEGHYERHLRRVRMACQERSEAMQLHFQKVLAGAIDLTTTSAGTHVIGRLSPPLRRGGGASRLAQVAAENDLVVFPLSRYCIEAPHHEQLVLGFGGLSPGKIAGDVEKLARTIEQGFSRRRRR